MIPERVKIWAMTAAVLLKIGLICLLLTPWALLVQLFPNARRLKWLFRYLTQRSAVWFTHHINGAKLIFQGELKNPEEPCIYLVASHASLLDIPLVMSLRPKMMVLTKGYVPHNPFYGKIATALGMFSVEDGYEQIVANTEKRIRNGCSLAVFPEGKRTPNGELQRFHKGAFYLAERLGLTIQPVFIYGSYYVYNRNEFRIHSHPIYVKYLEPIRPDDRRYGDDYRSRTKAIEAMFRAKMNDYK